MIAWLRSATNRVRSWWKQHIIVGIEQKLKLLEVAAKHESQELEILQHHELDRAKQVIARQQKVLAIRLDKLRGEVAAMIAPERHFNHNALAVPCAGTNCGTWNGALHSRECFTEHDTAVGAEAIALYHGRSGWEACTRFAVEVSTGATRSEALHNLAALLREAEERVLPQQQ